MPVPLRFAVVVSVLFVGGCGSSHGKVTGTVMYRNNPVAAGTVMFFVEGSSPVFAEITDGRYEALDVPVGEAMITVTAVNSDPDAAKAKKPKSGQKAPSPSSKTATPGGLPTKYGDPATSNLRLTVAKGDNTFDIPLSD
jgi:hypothetical protein